MNEPLFPDYFKEENTALGVRRVEKCCATCRYFDRIYEDAYCEHPAFLGEDDKPYVDDGMVCDRYEARQ